MVTWIKFVGFVVCGLFREWKMLFGGRLPVVSGVITLPVGVTTSFIQ